MMSDNDHSHDPEDPAVRVEAMEALLTEKGLIDSGKVDEVIRLYEESVGPMNGARLVARAWTDPEFKQALLNNATEVLEEYDFSGAPVQHLVAVENTSDVHNVVVCTLCSCYPWGILGLPPAWYKSPEYRSRVVREPRVVLAEMGLDLGRYNRGERMGQQLGGPLCGLAGTAGRYRRPQRGAARRARHT